MHVTLRRIARLLVWTLALAACGGDAPAETPAIAPTPSAEERPDEEPAAVLEAPTAAPAEPAIDPESVAPPVEEVLEATDTEALACDYDLMLDHEMRRGSVGPERGVEYPEIQHPDLDVRRQLNERIRLLAIAIDARVAAPDSDLMGDTRCEPHLVNRHVVSMICHSDISDERGEQETQLSGLHLRIDGGAVREMQLADVLVSGAELDQMALEACRREDGPFGCEVASGFRYAAALGFEGLVIEMGGGMHASEAAAVPYASIATQLLATGPLAVSLGRAPATSAPGAPPAVEAGGPAVPRWAVMPMAPMPELAAMWASLPAAQRESVLRSGTHLVGTDEAAARAAASSLGTVAEAVVTPATSSGLVLVRAARDVTLLDAAHAGAQDGRVLPRGTLLVTTEAPGPSRDTLFVVGHAELSGYVRARDLETADVCAPDLAPFLATLPEASRTHARSHTLRSALSQGSWGRATYETEIDGASHIELRRIEAGCTVSRSLARFTRPGTVQTLSVTRTARRGGESLIVTVTSEPSVSIHTFGREEPVWVRPLASRFERVETSQHDGDAWYPVVVRPRSGGPVRVAWGEDGPIVAAPPAP